MRGFFVTGTDTGVGKTVASAMLAAATSAGYWKPIQTGSDDDTAEAAHLAGCVTWPHGVRLPDPVSPHLAARRAGVRIDLVQLAAMAPRDGEWIVEGAGGILVPINETQTMLDWMVMLDLPVVIIARTTLGTINHTLLTLQAIRDRGLNADWVIMAGHPNADNRAAIEQYGKVRVTEVPWLDPLTPETLRRCAL